MKPLILAAIVLTFALALPTGAGPLQRFRDYRSVNLAHRQANAGRAMGALQMRMARPMARQSFGAPSYSMQRQTVIRSYSIVPVIPMEAVPVPKAMPKPM